MSSTLLSLAHRLRRRILAILRWRTQGVKVLAFDPHGRVLLVRHRYGRTDLYMLPGGAIGRGETPAAAAVREVREETGCTLVDVVPLARFEARGEGRRDTVFLFAARTRDTPVPDGREIAAAEFHAPDALPAATSPATRRRIDEWRGRRARGAAW